MKMVIYKRLTKKGKFYVGYTVKDCQLIDHFLSHSPTGNWHEGIFYEDTLNKLKLIAKIHGFTLREENESK
ncbi:MAG: hypothetical protein A2W22_06325 [Candidatus Levybacteria bacterium RBG_16_35_11]|nr:MAG: hypothetical protein A2W22_06325 [Candidatus Levybacteria bacterium RBG_16_35_11]